MPNSGVEKRNTNVYHDLVKFIWIKIIYLDKTEMCRCKNEISTPALARLVYDD